MRDVFVNVLMQLAENNPDIILLTSDLGFGVLTPFREKFPDQFVNAGVAEQNMTSLATGLALSGKTVFTYSIANFPTLRCLEQLRNDVCYHKANVIVVSIGGGFSYGGLGASHHATEDLAILRALPNLQLLVPSNAFEVEEATRFLSAGVGPGYLRLDKTLPETQVDPSASFEYGKARLIRNGSDATVICAGGILEDVLVASDILGSRGLSIRVMTMPSLSSIDAEAIATAVRETGALFTVEEHRVVGGLGGAIAEEALEGAHLPRMFHRFGIRAGEFVTDVGTQAYMKQLAGIDGPSLAEKIQQLLEQ